MATKTQTTDDREIHFADDQPVDGQLVQHVDTATGDKLTLPSRTGAKDEVPLSLRDATFAQVSTVPVTTDEDAILRKPINEDTEVDILPTGEVYMSHVFVRRRLNDAFKPMGWGLRPLSTPAIDPQTHVMYREYALIAKGVIGAAAFGSTAYQPTNARMDFADAAEAVRSNALTRCSKDFGIGSECWDPRFCQRWISKYAVHVWTGYKLKNGELNVRDHWRRVDSKPARGEFALVTDTPNEKHKDIKPFRYEVAANWSEAKEILYRIIQERKREKSQSHIREEEQREYVPPAGNGGAESSRARGAKNTKTSGGRGKVDAPPSGGSEAGFIKGGITAPQKDVEPWMRKHLIKNCRIGKRTTEWTLYHLDMWDGTIFDTFSKTVYERAQLCWASRTLVNIDYEEVDVKGVRKNQIQKSEWFQLWQREPGSDG